MNGIKKEERTLTHHHVTVPPPSFGTLVSLLCPARFTHDIIALTAFGIDVDSTRATEDRPCPSFHAIESTLMTLALVFDTIKS